MTEDDRNQDASDLEALFWLVLSGTQAGPRERLALVDELLSAPDHIGQQTGMIALRGMLRTGQFASSHDFSFGARAVDFGWRPKTGADWQDWYGGALAITARLALSESPLREAARQAIAQQFRGLWRAGCMVDQLEEVAFAIGAQEHWPEGWLAVGRTLGLDSQRMDVALVDRLWVLSERLAPDGFRERVQSYVLTPAYGIANLSLREGAEKHQEAFEAVVDEARRLGREAGSGPELLEGLWSALLGPNAHQATWFGEGLAETAADLTAAWADLRDRYAAMEHVNEKPALLGGFIRGAAARDKASVAGFLDQAVGDPLLGPVFPRLQVSVGVDEAGVRRLIASIKAGLAPADSYQELMFGKTTERVSPADLGRMVLGIAGLPDGHAVALEILSWHFHGRQADQAQWDASLLDCGRQLLCNYPFDQLQQTTDYELAIIAKVCLRGSETAEDAGKICGLMVDANSAGWGSGGELHELIETLLTLHPLVALDRWLGGDQDPWWPLWMQFTGIRDRNPLEKVPKPILLEWAQRDPAARCSTLAGVIPALVHEDNAAAWSDTALALVSAAPDRAAVLRGLATRLQPSSWSGSLADILEQRRPLIRPFLDDDDAAVRKTAREADGDLLQRIAAERKREVGRDERFE